MERLTERYGDRYIAIKGCTTAYKGIERKGTPASNAIVRLADYEDTGLEPKEVLTGKELAEIACAINLLKEYQSFGSIDHLRELAQAEKDGRLVVKPQPPMPYCHEIDGEWFWTSKDADDDMMDWLPSYETGLHPPYRPGDILYVRETFKIDYLSNIPGSGRIHYKADDTYGDFTFAPERYEMMRWAQLKPGWRPNENMPREATRIFLRVTDVRVQRVQDITAEECMAEGIQAWTKDGKLYKYYPADSEGDYPACEWQYCPLTPRVAFQKIWNDCYAKPRAVKVKGVIDHYESYPWEDIQETRTYREKPWYVIGNPWVWVIEFEQCEKPEEGA